MTSRRRRGGLATLAAMALVGSPLGAPARAIPPSVLPGLGPGSAGASDEGRVPVDVARPPWRAVVRVQTEIGARCSGALIGQWTVLTAAHCLFGRGTGRLVRPGSVHVLTGYVRGGYAGHARAVSLVTGPGFAMEPDGRRSPTAPADADWAVLTLDAPLGGADRVLPLLRRPPALGTPVMLGGFEQDRAEVMLADLRCAIIGLARDDAGRILLRHSCAATRGASGAPLLAHEPDGSWGIAGVASVALVGVAGGYAVPAGVVDPEATGARR